MYGRYASPREGRLRRKGDRATGEGAGGSVEVGGRKQGERESFPGRPSPVKTPRQAPPGAGFAGASLSLMGVFYEFPSPAGRGTRVTESESRLA